jgi:hypothetical protein
MSSSLRPASRFRSLSRFTNPWRARPFHPIAAASIAALVLSGCGGGDGSATSTDSLQADAPTAKFESFVSANPQVRATIEASPYGTKDDDLTGEEAERSAAQEDAAKDDSANDSSSSNGDEDADDERASSSDASSLVDTLISDMREMNDHPLKDVNPKYGFSRGPGYVLAGTNTGGANYLLPWFVQFEGVGNTARNTRVQIRNMRVFIKSRSDGKWSRLIDSDRFSGIQCDQGSNYFHCPQQAQVRDDDGSASTLPIPNLNLHGWWGGREPVQQGNMSAIVVSLEARLVKQDENGNDDRSKAKYLLHVGADYYPENASQNRILEAVGVSRSKMVTNDWQTFALTTLRDVGLQEPGGGITSSELRKDPPPLY